MIRRMLEARPLNLDLALLILRLFAAVLMAKHGYDKMTNFDAIMQKGFLPFLFFGPKVSLMLAIFAEFFCSILLFFGAFTRLALIPLIITMGVAFTKAHGGDLFGEGQAAFMFLIVFVTLYYTGPGRYSVDKFLFKTTHG